MSTVVEEESGTYTGLWHAHNGYYAGDFRDQPFQPTLIHADRSTAGPR